MEKETLLRLLAELRKRLIVIMATILPTAIACFIFSGQIRSLLLLPGKGLDLQLIFLTPAEALLTNLHLSFVAAALITLPIILYQVVALTMAASRVKRRGAGYLSLAMYTLFLLGLSFAYFMVLPLTLDFFLGFSAADLVAKLSIARYISFVVTLLFSFGLVFQLPLVFWFLGHIGILNKEYLRRNRKYALLVIVIISAVLTPPDIFSQVLMAIPLLILYEIGLILVKDRRDIKDGSGCIPF